MRERCRYYGQRKKKKVLTVWIKLGRGVDIMDKKTVLTVWTTVQRLLCGERCWYYGPEESTDGVDERGRGCHDQTR